MQEKNIFYHFSWLERGNGGATELAENRLSDLRENRLPELRGNRRAL
jgi:hypothetical protein